MLIKITFYRGQGGIQSQMADSTGVALERTRQGEAVGGIYLGAGGENFKIMKPT